MKPKSVVRIAVAMIVVHLAFRAWVSYGAWYVWDDFSFISRMLNDGLGPGVALREYAGHVMPAPMYLTWLFNAISPYDWRLTATFLLLLQAMAAFGLLRLLLTLFGPRKGILAPLALFLFTIFSVPVVIWWAAGANQLPLQVALFFGLASHVRYLRDRRTRDLVSATAWVVGGLLFYEKSLFVFAAYAIVTLAYFSTGTLAARIQHTWATYRTAVITYAAIGLAYLYVYIQVALNFSPSLATHTPMSPVAENIVVRGWLPGIFGGPLQWIHFLNDRGSSADPSDLFVLGSAIALVLLLRELRRTRSRSWRALLLPAFFLASNVILVTAGRASFVGPLIALDYRYQGELGAVTAIALGLALMPILGATEQVETIESSPFFDVPTRASLACVVVAVLGLVSASQYAVNWHRADFPKRYFTALLHDVRAQKTPIAVVDAGVPNEIMWGLGYPSNLQSHLLKQFPKAHFVTVASDHLEIVAPDGHVRPVVIPPVHTAVPKTRKTCAYRIEDSGAEIPLTGPLAYGGWWVRIGYVATADSPVTVSAGGVSHQAQLESGLHSLYFAAGPEPFDSVSVSGIEGDAVLCTDEVTVGRPEAARMNQE